MSSVKRFGARRNERGMHHAEAYQQERESFLKQLPPSWGTDSGYRARVSPLSRWTCIELDCWADPRKDQDWALEMIATIGMQRFQREFLRNWSLSTQSPFFSEYLTRGGDETYVYDIKKLGKGDIYAGLDFGFRRPAIVAAQTNLSRTRLYLLREWMPQNISAQAFMQVAEWLMGEYPEDKIQAEGLRHVLDLKRDAEKGDGPPVPWFHRPGRIIRFTGPEAQRTSQEVASEVAERRISDIWAVAGFPLQIHSQPVKQGELVLRHLLRNVPPGAMPWLVISPWCKIIRQAFGGGYTFKRPTKINPQPDEPAKDGYYEHLMDGLRYMASQVIDIRAKPSDNEQPRSEARPKPAAKGKEPGIYSRKDVDKPEPAAFGSQYDVPEPRWTKDVYTRGG
jgi:hypothetical protein